MPQGEFFWNPYRMVTIRNGVTRGCPTTDERFSGQSGIIFCSLENLTPLFVGKNRLSPSQFLSRNGRCVIPGSSLKGVLRSLAEIVGGGCFVTNHSGEGTNYKGIPNITYRACNDNKTLCITCRMFGMMGRGQNARVHKGNVGITDALIRENELRKATFQVLMMSHGARHISFYVTQGKTPGPGSFDGQCRKMYFHQPKRSQSIVPIPQNIQAMMQKDIQTIDALLPGHHFDFEVHFNNLEINELQLLIYVLALENDVDVRIGEEHLRLRGPLRHKIGYAKPLGMGASHITIKKLVYFTEPKKRFSSLQNVEQIVYEKDLLNQEISKLIQTIVNDKSTTMQQFRKMMVWDVNDNRTFGYPDYAWFNNVANSLKELKVI